MRHAWWWVGLAAGVMTGAALRNAAPRVRIAVDYDAVTVMPPVSNGRDPIPAESRDGKLQDPPV